MNPKSSIPIASKASGDLLAAELARIKATGTSYLLK